MATKWKGRDIFKLLKTAASQGGYTVGATGVLISTSHDTEMFTFKSSEKCSCLVVRWSHVAIIVQLSVSDLTGIPSTTH